MTKAQKCPVCEGKGVVPATFYPDTENQVGYVTCRSCNGTGIVNVRSESEEVIEFLEERLTSAPEPLTKDAGSPEKPIEEEPEATEGGEAVEEERPSLHFPAPSPLGKTEGEEPETEG